MQQIPGEVDHVSNKCLVRWPYIQQMPGEEETYPTNIGLG